MLKNIGYDENKQYTEQEINNLTAHLKNETDKINKQAQQQLNDAKIDKILSATWKFIIATLSCAIWLILIYFIWAPACFLLIAIILLTYIYSIYKIIKNEN